MHRNAGLNGVEIKWNDFETMKLWKMTIKTSVKQIVEDSCFFSNTQIVMNLELSALFLFCFTNSLFQWQVTNFIYLILITFFKMSTKIYVHRTEI